MKICTFTTAQWRALRRAAKLFRAEYPTEPDGYALDHAIATLEHTKEKTPGVELLTEDGILGPCRVCGCRLEDHVRYDAGHIFVSKSEKAKP
jgi:hypothetical protein